MQDRIDDVNILWVFSMRKEMMANVLGLGVVRINASVMQNWVH